MQPGNKSIKNKINHIFKKIFNINQKNYIPKHLRQEFEKEINYKFKDKNLIIQALKHRSYLSITCENRLFSNERLELLGDSVLGLVVTEHLYKKYPNKEEGDLTAIKSLVVSRKILTRIANKKLFLGRYLLLNEAEDKAGGRKRPSIVADALESVIGAVYLDGGLQQAIEFINDFILADLNNILNEERYKNFKSILLEFSQSKSYGLPLYYVKNEEGPDHNKTFTIEVKVNDQILGLGIGNSKKFAEQMAAKSALKKLSII